MWHVVNILATLNLSFSLYISFCSIRRTNEKLQMVATDWMWLFLVRNGLSAILDCCLNSTERELKASGSNTRGSKRIPFDWHEIFNRLVMALWYFNNIIDLIWFVYNPTCVYNSIVASCAHAIRGLSTRIFSCLIALAERCSTTRNSWRKAGNWNGPRWSRMKNAWRTICCVVVWRWTRP